MAHLGKLSGETAKLSRLQQLLECLDKAILDVVYNPLKTQKTAAIGTLL